MTQSDLRRAAKGIDHVLVGVADLEAARETYMRLGFTICPRGRHIGWGTANYCIMFADDYIELLGIVDSSQFTNNLDKFLAQYGEGLLALALATDDSVATQSALAGAGVETPPPQPLKRLLELPEGTEEPRFTLTHLPGEATPGLHAFIVEHLTPELIRRPAWLSHPNGATGVAALTVAVPDPIAAAATYGCWLGHPDRTRLRLGRTFIDLIEGEGGLVAMAVAVADVEATGRYLSARGLSASPADGGLAVTPEVACGVDLRFVAA